MEHAILLVWAHRESVLAVGCEVVFMPPFKQVVYSLKPRSVMI